MRWWVRVEGCEDGVQGSEVEGAEGAGCGEGGALVSDQEVCGGRCGGGGGWQEHVGFDADAADGEGLEEWHAMRIVVVAVTGNRGDG